MKASFKLQGTHRPVLVLQPDHGDEAILMAAFIRFDANAFSIYVERSESGQIKEVILMASEAS